MSCARPQNLQARDIFPPLSFSIHIENMPLQQRRANTLALQDIGVKKIEEDE
jgi:hypothetical protein